jgi:DnaJ-class molecular chaperone
MNPYTILQLESRDAPTIEDVKKAYKRMVLISHPDKPTGSNEYFQDVHDAYNTLIKELSDGPEDHIPLYKDLFDSFCKFAKAKPLTINLTVKFIDVYKKKIKRLEVAVKRKNPAEQKETLYISLNEIKERYVFPGKGDDCFFNDHRGDINVNIMIGSIPEQLYLTNLFSNYDISLSIKDCSLYDFYFKEEFEVDGIVFKNLHKQSYTLKNEGLPFGDDLRGDVYVKIELALPNVESVEEFEPFLKEHFVL